MHNIRKVQLWVKIYLNSVRIKRKQENIIVIQNYIRKMLNSSKKIVQLKAAEKIINFMKGNVLRKKFQSIRVSSALIKRDIFERVWTKIIISKKKTIEAYLTGWRLQNSQKSKIATANLNTIKIVSTRNLGKIQKYIRTFTTFLKTSRYESMITMIQKYVRKIIIRK